MPRLSEYKPDLYLAVEAAMTSEERERFLNVFCKFNPQYRGAHVADVLSALDDTDTHLDITEPLFEAHRDEVFPVPGLFRCAVFVTYYLTGAGRWEDVSGWMQRVRTTT